MLGMEQCLDRVEWDERLEKGLPIGRRDIREFKKPQQRHKGHQLKKKYIYFTYKSHDALKSFFLFITVETVLLRNKIWNTVGNLKGKFYRSSLCASSSQGNAEFGHFNLLLLFSRGQQRNVPAQPL